MASFGVRPLDEKAWARLRPAVRAAPRRVGWLLVHVLPPRAHTALVYDGAACVPVRPAARAARHGFERTRRLGKNRWVVTKVARCLPRPDGD